MPYDVANQIVQFNHEINQNKKEMAQQSEEPTKTKEAQTHRGIV